MTRVQFNKREVTNLIVIHCAATKPSMDIGLREIRQWHVQQGWLDIGYHYINLLRILVKLPLIKAYKDTPTFSDAVTDRVGRKAPTAPPR